MTLTRRSCIATLLGTTLPAWHPLARAQTPAAAVVDEVWTDATRKRDVPNALAFAGIGLLAAAGLFMLTHGRGKSQPEALDAASG